MANKCYKYAKENDYKYLSFSDMKVGIMFTNHDYLYLVVCKYDNYVEAYCFDINCVYRLDYEYINENEKSYIQVEIASPMVVRKVLKYE